MANTLYNNAVTLAGATGLGFTTNTISMVLATSGYTANFTTDQFLSALGANTVGTKQTLSGCAISNRVFTCNPVTFSSVPSGSTVIAYVFFIDTGNPATSALIGYIDTISSGSVNIPTTGSNIPFTPDSGQNGLFKM